MLLSWLKAYTVACFVCFACHRVMLVGWGGNNGTTVTAGILANKQ